MVHPVTFCAAMLAVWISGWGVPPETLRPLASAYSPGARLELLAPTESAAKTAAAASLVVGWSFGAFRILEAAARGQVFPGKVLLLAPFISFASEHGWGGRCTLTQLRWLKRWMARDSLASLQDFYQRAGIAQAAPVNDANLVEQWCRDLDVMMADTGREILDRFAGGLPSNFNAAVGECDPLLDARRIVEVLPGTRIVPGAGHECGPLLAALGGAHAI